MSEALEARTPSVEEPISGDEYVRWAYRLLLGREPESEAVVQNHPHRNNREMLLKLTLLSEEFTTKHGGLISADYPSPYQSWGQATLAFIHLPKTGGTTLNSLLSTYFPKQRICPERYGRLHLYSPAQLANYDFFSGHFDYFSTKFIPRRRVRCVSLFRDPSDRLISWYRFFRAHPATNTFTDNLNVKLAHELSAEEFFEHESTLKSPQVNNGYFSCFRCPTATDRAFLEYMASADSAEVVTSDHDEGKVKELLARAVTRILSLDAIGLTERFEESVELIFSTLGYRIPESIVPENVTDEMGVSRVPEIEMTPRLSRALHHLTRYDRVIYNAAKQDFERRLNARSTQTVEQTARIEP